ncbi:storkhead-box protein 1-like [Argiope bruennichi]|uniref:storkhead-box protein 1-like n=1 Tax=Argiope bruennichi TaxID=94029 RepID=UPI002493F8AA|nr:storkhead-box protein 1-like [Argiope bruennichi]
MSPSQKSVSNKPDTNKVLLSRGLAIVLKRTGTVTNENTKNNNKKKNRRQNRKELEIDKPCKGCEEIAEYEFGPEVFMDWTRENGECYWNPCLVQSVKSLEYKGFVRPTTLLVGGTDYSLEVVRSAWGRRMLRPPNGYDIVLLGDLDPVTMNLIAQTQFAPLPEALCKVVYDLTSEGIIASMQVISKRLKTTFPELTVPSDDILYKTLGTLIKERKLYHTGSGYSVVTPDTFRLLAMSPPLERQMLLTNEEAIVRLHGTAYAVDDGRTACTQTKQQEILTAWSSAERIVEPRKGVVNGKLKRCHSLKLLRSRDKEKLSRSNSFKSTGTSPGPHQDFRSDNENTENIKKEKSPSMFSKWFRRGRSDKSRAKLKGTSSSTQFPPRDWSDPDYVIFNSRATQTLDRNEVEHRSKGRSSSLSRAYNKDRHSQHLSSTPATPRPTNRNSNRQHTSDIYHYRSSSLSRKPSPSPKQEIPLPPNSPSKSPRQVTSPKASEDRVKIRPRYESPFSPFSARRKAQSMLMANEKYNNVSNGTPTTFNGKVNPYQSTDIIKAYPMNNQPSLNSSQLKKTDLPAGLRRPTSLVSNLPPPNIAVSEPLKQQPSLRVMPRLSFTPKETSPQNKGLPTTQTSTKSIVSNVKSTETVTKTLPVNGKEIKLGTTVDVEISLGNNRTLLNKKEPLTTDLDHPVKNDLLKIATSWNQSIKSNNAKLSDLSNKTSTGIPKLTTTTNITTSLTHGPVKDGQRTVNKSETVISDTLKRIPANQGTTLLDCVTGRDSPGKDTVFSSSPRSTMTSDAKSEFFSESPNTTTEVHISKDDSGFSSSASTSRPMSVSPC